ncbi:MAG: hypothetical protein LC657_08400, partial [Desulfobacteraceae bacterium]|nr:hypothetical protein [Desulfobacteraceae bacterium]
RHIPADTVVIFPIVKEFFFSTIQENLYFFIARAVYANNRHGLLKPNTGQTDRKYRILPIAPLSGSEYDTV